MSFILNIMRVQNDISPSFKAGLNLKMRKEISNCDVHSISMEFANNGIRADFKGNKFVAWSVLKAYQIVKNLKLGLPNAIIVENFSRLCGEENNSFGFCNVLPTKLYKDSEDIIPEKTLLFNENVNWGIIDKISDENFEMGLSPNNFFLDIFLHEFIHSTHEDNLLNLFGKNRFFEKVIRFSDRSIQKNFSKKYGTLLGLSICSYAETSPFEAIACDLSNRIVNNLDKNTLNVNSEFLKTSPYKKRHIYTLNIGKGPLYKALNRFWNGKFD